MNNIFLALAYTFAGIGFVLSLIALWVSKVDEYADYGWLTKCLTWMAVAFLVGEMISAILFMACQFW